MSAILEIIKASEERNQLKISNQEYAAILAELVLRNRHNNSVLSKVAQTLALGIISEGGDGF